MSTALELYKRTHSTLINRINHKIDVLMELLEKEVVTAEGHGISIPDATLMFCLDEPLDTISEFVIREAFLDRFDSDRNPDTPFIECRITIRAIGNDKPGVRVELNLAKNDKKENKIEETDNHE